MYSALRRAQRLVVAACLAVAASSSALAQQVVLVSVTTTGHGTTERRAVGDAVIAAVAQVNGEAIAQNVRTDIQTSVTAAGVNSSDRVAETISSSTKGVVRDSQVLSVQREGSEGLYKATVVSRVASFQQSEELNRVRLAVVSDASSAGDALSETVRDRLTDALVLTRKFAVLDRSNATAAEAEFARIKSHRVAIEERARLSAQAVPDLLVILGPVTRQVDVEGEKTRARARVRVLDYSSGQVRYATTASATLMSAASKPDALAERLARNLATDLIEHAYPPRVIHVQGDVITLSTGNSTYRTGDRVQLALRGEELTDPVTKESLGWAESRLTTAEIDLVTGRIATARVPSTASELLAKRFSEGKTIIARTAGGASGAQPARARSEGLKLKDSEDW